MMMSEICVQVRFRLKKILIIWVKMIDAMQGGVCQSGNILPRHPANSSYIWTTYSPMNKQLSLILLKRLSVSKLNTVLILSNYGYLFRALLCNVQFYDELVTLIIRMQNDYHVRS